MATSDTLYRLAAQLKNARVIILPEAGNKVPAGAVLSIRAAEFLPEKSGYMPAWHIKGLVMLWVETKGNWSEQAEEKIEGVASVVSGGGWSWSSDVRERGLPGKLVYYLLNVDPKKTRDELENVSQNDKATFI